MSFDIVVEDESPDIVFSEQIAENNLIYVTGFDHYGSNFFDPNGPSNLNSLLSINSDHGYWVKVNQGEPMTRTGFPILSNNSVHLLEGWSTAGYWFGQNMAPEEAFITLIESDNLVYVTGFNGDGATYFSPDPEEPFTNTLTALEKKYVILPLKEKPQCN